jgi:hypothetical protein
MKGPLIEPVAPVGDSIGAAENVAAVGVDYLSVEPQLGKSLDSLM